MTLTVHKRSVLPTVLESDALYFIPSTDATHVDVYVTNHAGGVVRHIININEIKQLIAENGYGIIKVDTLPEASPAVAGKLYSLNGSNSPCWCNGEEWIDLSKLTGGDSGSGTIDNSLLKKVRNELYFGIKLI